MTARRLWTIGGVVVIVAVLLLGWFLAISPMLSSVTSNDRSRREVEGTNAVLETQLATLSGIDAEALLAELGRLGEGIPGVIDEPALLRTFQDATAAVGATITSLTLSDPEPFIPSSAGRQPEEGESAAEGDAEPSPGATPPPAEAQPAEGPPARSLPIDEADLALAAQSLLVLRVQLSIEGDANQALALADILQHAPRRMLVTQVSGDPAAEPPTATLQILVWILPLEPVVLDGDEPAAG